MAGAQPVLGVRYEIWNDIPTQDILRALKEQGLSDAKISAHHESMEKIIVEFPQIQIPASAIAKVAESCFPSLRHLTRSWTEPAWKSDLAGIHQIMTLAFLNHHFQ